MNNNLKQFAQMLSEELKNKKPEEIISAVPSIPSVPEINNVKIEESRIDAVANYITKKKELKEQDNIEQNRWNDPLKQEPKFVTFKDMNDHYGLFLQRIQQQMSSMGGGGEVKFARLDDINSATVGTNKYLTYDQNTRKFYFDTIDTGEGIYLDIDNAVALSVASTTELGGIKIGDAFEIDGSDVLQLKVATNTELGGVKLGPGVTVNDQDQIIIDSTGLDFSFGDFAATIGTYTSNTEYAILSAINDNEDVVIASNGTGGINIVGQFHVHPTNGNLTELLEEEPVFAVKADGQVKILVPTVDSTSGAVSIVGSSLGQFISPVNTGVMLHVTGNLASPGIPSRIYNDAQNAFAAFVARRYNGTVASPTAVLANEEIMRISGTAHNGTNIPGTGNQRIVYKALGNQTPSNQGGDMEFWATPLNSTTIGKVATVGSTGITLETGKVLTGDVTGNATTVTNGVYTTDTSTVTNTMLAGSITNAKLANSTISGIALGSNLAALTIDGYLLGTSYNGSTGVTISVDATTAATASKVVARDANAIVAGSNFQGTVRNAGVVTGTTVTLNFNSDHMVHCTFIDAFTVAFSNYTAGRTITLIATNTSAADTDIITAGISSVRMQGDSTLTVTEQTTAIVTYYCVGTTVNDVYASAVYA
jgi:hypothetical protein